MIKKILSEISIEVENYFTESNFFCCIYGSYADGHHNSGSDIDLFVAIDNPSKEDLFFIKNLIINTHKKYKLALDAEVPYENKLVYSYFEIEKAIYLNGLNLTEKGFLKIPKIIKTKKFLSSSEIKSRLLFNAMTSPHIFLCGDRKKYLIYRNIAERNLLLLSILLNKKIGFVIKNLITKLISGEDGSSGELYLGYKKYKSIIFKLNSVLQKQIEYFVSKNFLILDKNKNCFLINNDSMFANLYKMYRYFKSTEENKSIKINWLKLVNNKKSGNYLLPKYYNKILKDYIFEGKTDLQIFSNYLKDNFAETNNLDILELGGGSGRSTRVFLERYNDWHSFEILDLSKEMIKFSKKQFFGKNIKFIKNDTINYLLSSKNKYDFVFSLWNLSHSIHQQILSKGIFPGSAYVTQALSKFLSKNLKPGGVFFIIHYDTLSEEQKIVVPQRLELWKDVFSGYDITKQSPSKQLIDETISTLTKDGIITVKIRHLKGAPIKYNSLDEAVEIFMNFHMEGIFNNDKNVKLIIKNLMTRIKKYQKGDDFFISPGCFLYIIRRLN